MIDPGIIIGDLVEVIEESPDDNSSIHKGQIGTVICFDRDSSVYSCGVQFDNPFTRGHDCGGRGKNGFCWYLKPHEYRVAFERTCDVSSADLSTLF